MHFPTSTPVTLNAAPKSFIFYFRYGMAAIVSGHGVTESDECYFIRSSDGKVIGTYQKSEVVGWHDTATLEARVTIQPDTEDSDDWQQED